MWFASVFNHPPQCGVIRPGCLVGVDDIINLAQVAEPRAVERVDVRALEGCGERLAIGRRVEITGWAKCDVLREWNRVARLTRHGTLEIGKGSDLAHAGIETGAAGPGLVVADEGLDQANTIRERLVNFLKGCFEYGHAVVVLVVGIGDGLVGGGEVEHAGASGGGDKQADLFDLIGFGMDDTPDEGEVDPVFGGRADELTGGGLPLGWWHGNKPGCGVDESCLGYALWRGHGWSRVSQATGRCVCANLV